MSTKQRVAAFALIVATLSGGALGVVATPAWAAARGGANGAKLLSEVQAAVASQRGFKWTDKGIEVGTTEYETTYVGKNGGSQSVTIDQKAGTGLLSVVVMGTTAYLKANEDGLVNVGFSPTAAKSEAGKWISISDTSDQSVYVGIASGITTSTVAASLGMSAPVTELRESKVSGQSVLGLKGTAAPTAGAQTGTTDTLYVAARGTPLPVKFVQDNPSAGNTFIFSDWGRAPRVNVPSGAVAFQTTWT
jgi:hypothetical protein